MVYNKTDAEPRGLNGGVTRKFDGERVVSSHVFYISPVLTCIQSHKL